MSKKITRGLTFPKDLIQPQKSQVVRYEDSVSDRVRRLSLYASKLAEGFGIPMTDFKLSSENKAPQRSDEPLIQVLTAIQLMSEERQFVTLERRKGVWDLYYVWKPSMFDRTSPSRVVSLRDAPLDVREEFLKQSEEFFRTYLNKCEHRLSKMRSSVKSADRTLALLERMTLD